MPGASKTSTQSSLSPCDGSVNSRVRVVENSPALMQFPREDRTSGLSRLGQLVQVNLHGFAGRNKGENERERRHPAFPRKYLLSREARKGASPAVQKEPSNVRRGPIGYRIIRLTRMMRKGTNGNDNIHPFSVKGPKRGKGNETRTRFQERLIAPQKPSIPRFIPAHADTFYSPTGPARSRSSAGIEGGR